MASKGYDLEEVEDAAADLRGLAGLGGEFMDAARLVRALGGELDPRAPSGCRGGIQTSPLRVQHDPDALPVEQTKDIAHELGHIAAVVAGRERCEVEATAIGAALLLPRPVIDRVVRWCGYSIGRIGRVLPGVPASMWIPRLCIVRGCVIITRTARGRKVFAGPGLEHIAPRARPWELELVRLAERADERAALGQSHHRDLFGVTAWVLGRKDPWSAIVLSPETLDVLVGRSPLLEAPEAPANGTDPAMQWWLAARVG